MRLCFNCALFRAMMRGFAHLTAMEGTHMSTPDPAQYRFVFEFDLADRLRKSLRVSGWSVQAIADQLGVSRNTVSNWINGRVTPTREQLTVWAAYTGAPLQWLERGTVPDMDC